MPNNPLRDFAYVTRVMSRTAQDANVLMGRNGPERFVKRLVRREVMRRVIGPALNNIFRSF